MPCVCLCMNICLCVCVCVRVCLCVYVSICCVGVSLQVSFQYIQNKRIRKVNYTMLFLASEVINLIRSVFLTKYHMARSEFGETNIHSYQSQLFIPHMHDRIMTKFAVSNVRIFLFRFVEKAGKLLWKVAGV